MSNREDLLTPVGRLVQGSLYEPQTTDAEGKPLVIKTGVNAGQARVEYYFALAIEKKGEPHWSQTAWGAKIWAVGHKGFPNGQADSPHFAWKIQDGDSAIPNKAGRKNIDREGYPGHWVLNFASGFAPAIYNEDGTKQLLEPDFIKLGYYIQVFGSISDNGSQQQPGVYLNHSMVAFSGYGNVIILGADPKAVGFGKSTKPAGVLHNPPETRFNPATPPAQSPPIPGASPASVALPQAAAAPAMPVVPHYGILNPPVAATQIPARMMLPAAQGATYEQLIAAGWNDTLLVQYGLMQA